MKKKKEIKEIPNIFHQKKDEYYGEFGCCLTCPKAHTGCLCYNCKCRKCLHYVEKQFGGGYCDMTP